MGADEVDEDEEVVAVPGSAKFDDAEGDGDGKKAAKTKSKTAKRATTKDKKSSSSTKKVEKRESEEVVVDIPGRETVSAEDIVALPGADESFKEKDGESKDTDAKKV